MNILMNILMSILKNTLFKLYLFVFVSDKTKKAYNLELRDKCIEEAIRKRITL